MRRPGTIGYIAHPFIASPFQNLTFGIIGFAVDIAGSPVIHDPAVDRPDISPVGIQTKTGRIILPALGHLVLAVRSEAAAMNPVAGGRCSVVLEVAEARHALALFEFGLRFLCLVFDHCILQEDSR